MCDSFAGRNIAKQTSFGKLAWPDNYITSSLGPREQRKESRLHKVALMDLVWVTEWECTNSCPGTDFFKGSEPLELCLEQEDSCQFNSWLSGNVWCF